MIENSVTISPKKASDESNTIDKWLLGIRKEVLVLICQSICQEDNLKEDDTYLQNIIGVKITVIFNILTTIEFMDLKWQIENWASIVESVMATHCLIVHMWKHLWQYSQCTPDSAWKWTNPVKVKQQ